MKNKYVPILQEVAPSEVFDLDALVFRGGELEVRLLDKDGGLKVLLFGEFLIYRQMGESDAFLAICDVKATSRLGRSFYRVEDSEFLEWFHAQNHGIRESDPLMHISIMTLDHVIDVICEDAPSFQRASGQHD